MSEEKNNRPRAKVVVITILFVLIGAYLGFYFLPSFYQLLPIPVPQFVNNFIVNIILGGLILYLISLATRDYLMRGLEKTEELLSQLSLSYILFGVIGIILGLIVAWLVNLTLIGLQLPFISNILPIIISVALSYFGFRIATSRREEFQEIFANLAERNRKKDEEQSTEQSKEEILLEAQEEMNFRQYKVLDTSVIIDGRIKEVLETGFLEGTLIVSDYVLKELQQIADSSDSLKRERGRRGLDILNDLQKNDQLPLQIVHDDLDEAKEVDEKLVVLANKLEGTLVTNDYNLNKVAEFQNTPVLNINELANSVKPLVIPGEKMTVTIVKEGTERAQGVGYLSDGTMIVVEEGKHHLNETLDVVVTSSLQTSAGRMIFSKIADD